MEDKALTEAFARWGWTAAGVAVALERNPHTIGEWRALFCRDGPTSITFVHS